MNPKQEMKNVAFISIDLIFDYTNLLTSLSVLFKNTILPFIKENKFDESIPFNSKKFDTAKMLPFIKYINAIKPRIGIINFCIFYLFI